MKRLLAKSVVATILMNSSLSNGDLNDIEYIENSKNYSSTPAFMMSGWNWGLNKASAAFDDSPDYSSGPSYRYSSIERIRVTGQHFRHLINVHWSFLEDYYARAQQAVPLYQSFDIPNYSNTDELEVEEEEMSPEELKENLIDKAAQVAELKTALFNKALQMGLTPGDIVDMGLQDFFDKLDNYVSKTNTLIGLLSSGIQVYDHVAMNDYEAAASELIAAGISAGLGAALGSLIGGPTGIIVGALSGIAFSDFIENMTNALVPAISAYLRTVYGEAVIYIDRFDHAMRVNIWYSRCSSQFRRTGKCNIAYPTN